MKRQITLALIGAMLLVANAVIADSSIPSSSLAEQVESLQQELMCCGPRAMCFSLKFMGYPIDPEEIEGSVDISANGVALSDLVRIGQRYREATRAVLFDSPSLCDLPIPSILVLDDVHCVVYCGASDESGLIHIFDPRDERMRYVPPPSICRHWHGEAIVFEETGGLLWYVLSGGVFGIALTYWVVGTIRRKRGGVHE